MTATAEDGLLTDGRIRRCSWCGEHADYQAYHDEEWGQPVNDDRRLFEKICLEAFQSGLSWLTILRKRTNFRAAFADFDFAQVARFGERDVERLLADAGIIRHRGKIEAAVQNARAALDTAAQYGSLAAYFWRFEPPAGERPAELTHAALRELSQTPTSKALAKDLKRHGWCWVGPTTCYAFMQAMGLVNDHLAGCSARARVERARVQFQRPV